MELAENLSTKQIFDQFFRSLENLKMVFYLICELLFREIFCPSSLTHSFRSVPNCIHQKPLEGTLFAFMI